MFWTYIGLYSYSGAYYIPCMGSEFFGRHDMGVTRWSLPVMYTIAHIAVALELQQFLEALR